MSQSATSGHFYNELEEDDSPPTDEGPTQKPTDSLELAFDAKAARENGFSEEAYMLDEIDRITQLGFFESIDDEIYKLE